ncbi:hypothetical protein CAC42_2252 [Sphaceloma murrayae]|uniref:Uncharacterized protein n=1 Tax=Sphaceloma murrayae TaxID=2082308 RepID=A0A2K1QJI9_9PEZI|nr:hypothetical protein CAC42_2252 [Sphaceloma murrayae]
MTSFATSPSGTNVEDRGLQLHAQQSDPDIQLKHPSSDTPVYVLSAPRDPGDQVFALHRGSKLDPVVAAIRFEGYFRGDLTLGDPNEGSPWGQWEQPSTKAYTAFSVHTSTGEHRFRWQRTGHSKRTGAIKLSGYHVWVLKEMTDASANAHADQLGDIATLSLEREADSGDSSLKDKLLKRGKEKADDYDPHRGTLHFYRRLHPGAQDAAIALLLALWHRDRSIKEKKPLDPHSTIKEPKTAKQMAGLAGGSMFAGVGTMGAFGGVGLASGAWDGGGGDCGGGGGGGC